MTTWPPRYRTAHQAMQCILSQAGVRLRKRIHPVMVLSEEEVCDARYCNDACALISRLEKMGVEIIYDPGNIRSHKKLMPTIGKYPDNPILVVDDDNIQAEGWLKTFLADHDAFPDDIIYGQSNAVISVNKERITETRCPNTHPGDVTIMAKPANGAAGTLYPAHTFTDPRFFDRSLFMSLSPSSDETWQWAFAKIAGKTFRCLSRCNYPYVFGADQSRALFYENQNRYTDIHNRIASAIPEYVHRIS